MGSDKQLKPSSFGSQLRRTSENVPIHGEPNLEGFSFPVTVPSHDSNEPAWAAGRENTGRGLTRLLTTPPVSEGWHKREGPVVRHTFHRDNRCLTGLLVSSSTDMGME